MRVNTRSLSTRLHVDITEKTVRITQYGNDYSRTSDNAVTLSREELRGLANLVEQFDAPPAG